ncbi:MAG: ribonuclease R [Lactobacillales bacterium]|nr:ribonuclease R [Lactobacillales bacterium]
MLIGDSMEDRILELLNKENASYEVNDIFNMLNLKTVDEFKELIKELNRLEDELKVYRTNKNKYIIFKNSNLKLGILMATKKNYAFVDIEGDEDVFIPPMFVNNAINGDKVVVEITSKKGMKLEGRIVRIVERKLKEMVGEVYYKNNKAYIKLDDEKVKLNICIDSDKTKGAMEGHKVVVKITSKLEGNTYRGEVLKIIGHKNDPGVDILSIVNKFGIEDTFSDEVMKELDDIPDIVSEEEMIGRKDLRNEMIFTIDGDDTKDIDDAIAIKKLDNGNYELGVHIADVSYYVKEGSKLYESAMSRGTSVYLADRVIPMLPHKLSNGICSLNPGVDRLAMSCVMEINPKGDVVSYDIFESVIRSRKQMTYKNVNKILEENIIPEGYEEYVDSLRLMSELADILRENKVRRGYIDFGIEESKIIVNETGEAIDVVLRERGVGEKLIEDFMIAANETVATCIYFMELPFVYRVHGEPNEEKINKFLTFVSSLGYQINGKVKDLTPVAMQKLLEQLNDKKEYHILSSMLLRSMQKAIYDTANIGHFGLGSKCYTHFTSPIRRFPDTTVHRLLRKYLFKKQINNDVIEYEDKILPVITEHSSKKERDSVECEREVDDMKKAEYMEKHVGETYEGMISSIMSFGMFVELPNLVEGLIRLDDLVDDHYTFDESTISLIGKNNKRGYRLGDNVGVIVKAANKEARTVDFVLDNDHNRKIYMKRM